LAVSNSLRSNTLIVGRHRLFGDFRGGWLWLCGASEGIRTLSPSGTSSITAASGAFTVTATTIATTGCLRALLLDQGIQLSVLKHLPEAANGKTEYRNRGAEIEGLLKRPYGAHLVITQSNTEAAAFPVAATASAGAFSATACLSPALLGLSVGISHGLGPAISGKCGA
jgi:hypothetical protein